MRRAAYVLVLVLVLATACGDDLAGPVDAPAPQPDLALVAAEMNGHALVTYDTFAASSCEIEEGCIDAPGTRRLLRFPTVTENLGADLDLGVVPPDGVSSGIFVWSPCHMHHHILGYARFELRDAHGVVAAGHKQAFCLEDDEQIGLVEPSRGFTCKHQGITRGWADVYSVGLPCQWIDVSDVVPGTYTLHVVIDEDHVLPDADPTNNEWSTTVTL